MNDKMTLYYTPYAFAKLIYMRDIENAEVGGWGITAEGSPLVVRDFMLCPQEVGSASVDFDDDGLVQFFDKMAHKYKLQPFQFSRIWIHTHPGSSASPSGTDETTFTNALAQSNYAIMAILAKNGNTYARLQLKEPFTIQQEMNTAVHWGATFPQSKKDDWQKEYEENVTKKTYQTTVGFHTQQYNNYVGKRQGYVWDSEQNEFVHHTQTKKAQRDRKANLSGKKAKKKRQPCN